MAKERAATRSIRSLLRVNQPDGFDCPGCAWPEPDRPGRFEFCENGVKAVAFEATSKRVTSEFFAQHTLRELQQQTDHWLEAQGRLTHPMRYDVESDRYLPITWDEAFEWMGGMLRSLDDPNQAVFYTSGRTSNEAAFLYQLFGRMLGTNNFPDCSNMCHESSGCAMTESIGIGKGTVTLEDFEKADAIFVIGQNPGTNHPRMLGVLLEASVRGAKIVSINPLRERGLSHFLHPQHVGAMLTNRATPIAGLHLPVSVGGDLAALKGLVKWVLEAEVQRPGEVLDRDFIDQHTDGFEVMADEARQTLWVDIESQSGLSREQLKQAADIYLNAERVIVCWAMGITQQKHAVATIQYVLNWLMMRGHLGQPGAGACPVRGHSNVQGDRTVGITEKPGDLFLDRLGKAFGFEPPREHGFDTVHAIRAMAEGRVRFFMGMGGNFVSATPDTDRTAEALRRCAMTVHVSTKLNRSHLVVGAAALILPCLGRTERDVQSSGLQRVTVEDSMSNVHASVGRNAPASEHLMSEPAIVAGLALAALEPSSVDWVGLVGHYDRIRDKMAEVMPELFSDYNTRIQKPGGFYLGNPARDRNWQTPSGRAQFKTHPLPDLNLPEGQLRLMTLRSHDQYNTTVYGLDDRYRGIQGTRHVLFMNVEDLAARGLADGDVLEIQSQYGDGIDRRVQGFQAVAYDIPVGCCAGYFPELNVLVSLDVFADKSHTPASKFVPIVVRRSETQASTVRGGS